MQDTMTTNDLITASGADASAHGSVSPDTLLTTSPHGLDLIPVDTGRPENLPEKFWDEKQGSIRFGALLGSYIELEKKLSRNLPIAEGGDDKENLFRALGRPDSPDLYEVDCQHGLFNADPDVNQKLFDTGLSRDQVQTVYDLAAEKFVPMILDMAEEFKADREVERLISTFGGAEKWQEVSRQLLAFGQKNLPHDVLDNLSGSFEGVMMLYRMMKGQEPALSMDASAGAGTADEGELQTMMRDPRYWRDKDPKFVAKVTDGFKSIYST
jgi:hypothetical protein